MPAVQRQQRPVYSADRPTMRRHRPDYWLLILCVALLSVGVIVVYSISPALAMSRGVSENYFITRQLIAIGLGVLVFAIASRLPLEIWRKAYKPLLALAALATIIALLMPTNPLYPAHRWIRLGSFSFQSVELLKFAVLIWMAGVMSSFARSDSPQGMQRMLRPLLAALGVIGLVVAFIQSDLGSAAVIIAMFAVMAYVIGLPMKRLVMVGVGIAAVLVIAVVSTPYRRDRLATFLNPTENCQTTGYQACEALISVGSGGFAGLGLGKSVQAYGYLPEAANDSIFAIYAEKFGFLGVAALLGLFAVLFGRLKRIAERAPDDFSRLIVIGVLTWLSVQAIINIGAMLGMLPLKGITLPLVSYGGTSVVFVLAALGVVFQISRYTTHGSLEKETETGRGGMYADRPDRRRIGGSYNPAPGRRLGA